MPGAFLADDIASMLNVNEFATSCTLTPATGPAVTIKGIFDNGAAIQSVGGIELVSTGPQLTCASADVPANWRGATLTINATVYNIVKPEPDGTGLTVLQLHKA